MKRRIINFNDYSVWFNRTKEPDSLLLTNMKALYQKGERAYFSSHEFMEILYNLRVSGESQCSFMKSELYKWWLQLPLAEVDFSSVYYSTRFFPVKNDLSEKLFQTSTSASK